MPEFEKYVFHMDEKDSTSVTHLLTSNTMDKFSAGQLEKFDNKIWIVSGGLDPIMSSVVLFVTQGGITDRNISDNSY